MATTLRWVLVLAGVVGLVLLLTGASKAIGFVLLIVGGIAGLTTIGGRAGAAAGG